MNKLILFIIQILFNRKIDNLKYELSEETILSSSQINQTTQTDDQQQQDRFLQINNKLKRALQTIKEKIQRIIHEKPELFPQINDDTIQRLDQLISLIQNQAKQIEILQNERSIEIQQLSSQISSVEDYQKQINQLQQDLSQKEEEHILLQHHLNNIQFELKKKLDHQTLTTDTLQIHIEERNLQLTEL